MDYEEEKREGKSLFSTFHHYFLDEMRVLLFLYPEMEKHIRPCLEEGQKGRWYVRNYVGNGEYTGYYDIYGHFFEGSALNARLAAFQVFRKLPKRKMMLPYVYFSQQAENGIFEQMTPIENWLYYCLDLQCREPQYGCMEILDRENPYLLPLFAFFEAFLQARKGKEI